MKRFSMCKFLRHSPELPMAEKGMGIPPSKECVDAIHKLRFAQEHRLRLNPVLNTTVSRLISDDMHYVFQHFASGAKGRSFEIACKVLEMMRKESWYKPEVAHYSMLIQGYCEGENGVMRSMGKVHSLLVDAKREGLSLEADVFQASINCCLRQCDFHNCMRIYRLMHDSDCHKEYSFYDHLTRSFRTAGFEEQSERFLAEYDEITNESQSEEDDETL